MAPGGRMYNPPPRPSAHPPFPAPGPARPGWSSYACDSIVLARPACPPGAAKGQPASTNALSMSATKELQDVDVEWAPADHVLQALQKLPVTERRGRGGVESAAGDEGVIPARKRGAHARGSYAPRTSLSHESLRLEEGKSLGARRERKQPEPSHPACTRAGTGASERKLRPRGRVFQAAIQV